MSVQALSIGIYTRWNDASLNSSIAPLYAAGDTPQSGRNSTGTPAGNNVPRAEYTVAVPAASSKTRGTRVYQGVANITVHGRGKATVDGYIKSIYDTFLNSEEAATNPFTMTSCSVLEVEDGGGSVLKVDDTVFRGEITLFVRYSVNNAVPG